MSQFCISCGVENSYEAKFCKSCGQKLDKDEYLRFDEEVSRNSIKHEISKEVKKDSKDLSLWYLLIPFFISSLSHFQEWKVQYAKEDVDTLDFALYMIGSGVPEVYGELLGAGIAPILLAVVIVGIVWIIKLVRSKIYSNAKLSLFIWSLIFAFVIFYGSL